MNSPVNRTADATKAIAATLNSFDNAAIQQSKTASAINELTEILLLSKEVEQEELYFVSEEIKSKKPVY